MITDWKAIGYKIGTIREDGESGGDSFAKIALEEILGQEWIETTVEQIVSFKRGFELAMSCLRYIHSERAVLYAYNIYKTSNGDRAAQAVWLIKHIAHPVAFDWIEEFLNDNNVMIWGIGVLDQLLWSEQIIYDEKANSLLNIAEEKANGELKGQVEFIREYIQERSHNS
ncbi:MAG: hypothetical protein ACTHMD_03565 [Flavisolibacter sp.]